MSVAENQLARERLIEHWRRSTGSGETDGAARLRHVEVFLSFGAGDVETLAERLEIPISDEETGAILDRVDSEANQLTRDAARRALQERIAALLQAASRAHTQSEDD
jgi:hypothetical protein